MQCYFKTTNLLCEWHAGFWILRHGHGLQMMIMDFIRNDLTSPVLQMRKYQTRQLQIRACTCWAAPPWCAALARPRTAARCIPLLGVDIESCFLWTGQATQSWLERGVCRVQEPGAGNSSAASVAPVKVWWSVPLEMWVSRCQNIITCSCWWWMNKN